MKLIGHRGGKDEWPENTLVGFRNALEVGMHGLELDVHGTKDGKLVVIHDPTLERTTNGKGAVADKTYSEIKELDAGNGEPIPLLEDCVDLVLKKNAHLFIESKALGIEKEIAELVKAKKAYENVTVICFNHFFVKEVKRVDSRIQTGCLIYGTPTDCAQMVKSAGADLVAINIKTHDPRLRKNCVDGGVKVAVWNANSKEEFEYVSKIGADFIMTDKPSLIASI